MTSPHDLTQGSIAHHLYRMTVPMVWALFANFAVQMTDIWFISMLGHEALTAMGFVFPVMMVVFSLSIGLSAGAASVVARFAPVKSKHDMQCLVTDTLMLCLGLGVVLAVIGISAMDVIFLSIGADERLLPLIHDYMQIFFFNNIITMVAMNGLACVRALGDSKAQASSMIAASLVNLILDPIFIFGWGPIPRMELQGAVLATTVARVVTLSMAFHVIMSKRLLTLPSLNPVRLKHSWGTLLHIALPAAGTNMIIPFSGAIITALLASYGEYAVAGLGVATRIEPMMLIVFYAMSSIVSPFVGQNLGVNALSRIHKSALISCQFAIAYGLFLTLVLWLFAKPVVALFTEDPKTAKVAVDYLLISSLSYGAAGVVMIVNACFNGLAKPLQATTVSVLRVIILYLPLAWGFSFLWQERGIFAAYSVVNFLCGGFGYYWFMRTSRSVCEAKGQSC